MHVSSDGSSIVYGLGRSGFMYEDPDFFKTDENGKWKVRTTSEYAYNDIQIAIVALIGDVRVYTHHASNQLIFN